MGTKPLSYAAQARQVTWFSRIVRWLFGLLFIVLGIRFAKEDGWPMLVFGLIIFATGFIRPRRCIDNACAMPQQEENTTA